MHRMPCAAPCVCAHAGRPWSSRTTTVELNMKSEHNLYLACEDSPQRAFFFCTFSCSRLALLAPTVPWLLFLNAANHQLRSVLNSTNAYVAEDQPQCPTHTPLSRSAVLPCPPCKHRFFLIVVTNQLCRNVCDYECKTNECHVMVHNIQPTELVSTNHTLYLWYSCHCGSFCKILISLSTWLGLPVAS